MSYDIYLRAPKCEHCGRSAVEPELPNPTYNLTAIFDLALSGETLPSPTVGEGMVAIFGAKTDRPRGLRLLSGRKAVDTQSDLTTAIERMDSPAMRADFKAIEPENGWGDLKGAISVVEQLRAAAHEYPLHTWEVR